MSKPHMAPKGELGIPPKEGSAVQGLRYNTGKNRLDLIPPDALAMLGMIYTKGAEKYAPRNWEKGLDWSECYGSLQRHCLAWQGGEDLDEESGQPHMAHVTWNAMALLAFHLRGIGTDSRSKL